MKLQIALTLVGVLLAACSGTEAGQMAGSTQPSDSTQPSTPTADETTVTKDPATDSITCWIAPTEGAAGPIGFEESTEELGLIDPLTGLFGHASAFGDIDGDDRPDLLVGTFGDRKVEKYQFRGADGPANDQLLTSKSVFVSSDILLDELGRTSGGVFADLDGDGDDDLLLIRHAGISRQSEVPSRIYENTGNGELFAVSEPLPAGFLGRTPAIADFDGDGLLDLYVSEDKFGSRGGILLHTVAAWCSKTPPPDRVSPELSPSVRLPQISMPTRIQTWSPPGTYSSIRET